MSARLTIASKSGLLYLFSFQSNKEIVMKSLSLNKGVIMDIQATKLAVMRKIMNVSKESLLQKIENLLEDEMVVGYTVTGKPLTKKIYNRRLKKAQKQILSGEYTTQEDLERESENW